MADPLAALVIAGVAVKEGIEAWRGEQCDDCTTPIGADDSRAGEHGADGCGCAPGGTDACCTDNETTNESSDKPIEESGGRS